ncbi:Ycf48-like protein [Aquisphaera giovannonii]|uniref:Ycf48-like protein n=1 Tax=Aquisphaera giovannonii TaxID=406548 RepID=A0A5B9W1C5_9BACT|nr:hypothetical protein [Aquisphaera giovannonii]QEH33805.1 Ycf48-like protein [Aquisphaera giovannonii]
MSRERCARRAIVLGLGTLVLLHLQARVAVSQWEPQASGTRARLRGVSAASHEVAWASGTSGTVLRTDDGGKTWRSVKVPATEQLDFRDVHAVDEKTAFVLSIGPGARSQILKTTDGGATWIASHSNRDPDVFLDAIAFWDPSHGIAMGDPVRGRFDILVTDDGGRSWARPRLEGMPEALPGEGAFAASGTCLATGPRGLAWFCTGGASKARVFRSTDRGRTFSASDLPIAAGAASSGAFSVDFRDERHGLACGGDYRAEEKGGVVLAITEDGGKTWRLPKGPAPRAFRSAVAYLPGEGPPAAVAVGPSGVDLSTDGGESWRPLGDLRFHAASFAAGGVGNARCTGWGVGEDGRIARIRISRQSR